MLKSLAAEVLGVNVDPRQGGTSLAALEWRYRVIVVVAVKDDDRAARQASLLLDAADGLRERDLILIELGDTEVTTLFGPQHDFDVNALRYDLDVDGKDFVLILVGKDGTVKLRSNEMVSAADIFSLIDQMPMRRKEADGERL